MAVDMWMRVTNLRTTNYQRIVLVNHIPPRVSSLSVNIFYLEKVLSSFT